MQNFLLIFTRGLRGPYGKGLVGHYTSGHSLNPSLCVTVTVVCGAGFGPQTPFRRLCKSLA